MINLIKEIEKINEKEEKELRKAVKSFNESFNSLSKKLNTKINVYQDGYFDRIYTGKMFDGITQLSSGEINHRIDDDIENLRQRLHHDIQNIIREDLYISGQDNSVTLRSDNNPENYIVIHPTHP